MKRQRVLGRMRRLAGLAAAVLAAATAFGDRQPAFEVRAVLLDLARQTETVPSACALVDRVADAGYNTLLIYLKGILRTKAYPYAAPGESYSADEMRAIVAHAESLELNVIPYFSLLGHGEPYFRHPELQPLGEEREGRVRWPDFPPATWCLSKPETRDYLARYVDDILEVFPGKDFHIGMDESWNMGFCSLCEPKRREKGFGGLFSDFVDWAHGLLVKRGRRVWMWDDFYEFFPEEISRIPKDTVLCHWQYDAEISRSGIRGRFLNRVRRDWLADYERQGLDVVFCTWLDPENIRTFTAYARRHRVKGAMLTMWEPGETFWGAALPKLFAAGRLWGDLAAAEDPAGDFLDYGIRRAYPGFTSTERLALDHLLRTPRFRPNAGRARNLGWRAQPLVASSVRLAQTALASRLSKEVPADALSPDGLVDDLMAEWDIKLAREDFRLLTPLFADPKRTAADVRSAKAALARVRERLARAAARRAVQERMWRPGCWPNVQANKAAELVAYADELAATPEAPASDDEWWVELVLHLPEFHGIPRWTVDAMFGGVWRTVAAGSWKPGSDGGDFVRFVPFRSSSAPTRLRISYHGNGSAGLDFIAVENRVTRLVPNGILAAQGDVDHVERLLRDDFQPVLFGTSDRAESFHHPELAEKTSSVELSLVRQEDAGARRSACPDASP